MLKRGFIGLALVIGASGCGHEGSSEPNDPDVSGLSSEAGAPSSSGEDLDDLQGSGGAAGTATPCPVGTQGKKCTRCEPGSYCAGDGAAALACASGRYDHDGDPATSCVPQSDCIKGQFVTDEGNALHDRVCADCESGSYSSEINAVSCLAWSDCAAGSFVSEEGSAKQDRSCRACQAGAFSTDTNASECLDWSNCLAGSRVAREGTTTTDRACEACEAGFFSASDNQAECLGLRDCGPGEWLSFDGDLGSDRSCAGCAPGTFSTETNADACLAWTDCAPGSQVTNLPSSSLDRNCELCPEGSYTTESNLSLCSAGGECPAGTVETAPGTLSSPPVCAPCAVGNYCEGSLAPEVACSSGTFDHDANPATSCIGHTDCVPGQEAVTEGTSTVDRECVACPAESFSSEANSACLPWTTCSAGSFVSQAASSVSDRICAVCAVETITFADNLSACEPIVPVQIASGGSHTCVLRNDGSVRCFGSNTYGQLGYGHTDTIGDDETPASAGSVSLGEKALQVTVGLWHSCALLESGNVRCWGRSNYGQLGGNGTQSIGDNELPSSSGPVAVGAPVTQVVAGAYHTCALRTGGEVSCWGRGNVGQLGYGNVLVIGDNEVPSSAGTLSLGGVATQLALGLEHSCALLSDNTVRCWGRNNYGQLGGSNITTLGDDETPVSVGVVDVGALVASLATGDTHTCALLTDGGVKCWGRGSYGQLGYGNTLTVGDDELPSALGVISVGGMVTEISAGTSHTCALLANQTVRCWGRSSYGQLGYGNALTVGDNEVPSFVAPVDVGGLVTHLSVGANHSCTLSDESKLTCFGYGASGQLGYGSTTNIGDNELPSSAGEVILR